MNLIKGAPQDIQDTMSNILDTLPARTVINRISKDQDNASVEVIFGVTLQFSRLLTFSRARA